MLVPPPPPPPAWLTQPSAADLARAEALYAQVQSGGRAAMTCYVRADGLLEACAVDMAKTRPGLREAALALAPSYRLDLAVGSPGPQITVPLVFPQAVDAPVRVIAEPTPEAVAAATPRGVEGEVWAACAITATGVAEACEVQSDPAHDARLDAAALSLAAGYRFAPARLKGAPVATYAMLRMRLGASPRVVTMPDFARRPTGVELSDAYPRLAAASRLPGRALIQCQVAVSGKLEDCQVIDETPRGLGFGEAALQMAPKFAIRPKTIDGRPTTGGSITIPINFEEGGQGVGGETIKILPYAPWIRSPSADDVIAAFPKTPGGRPTYDIATILCAFRLDGRLRDCEATTPQPRAALDAAALSLAPRFQIDTTGVSARTLHPLRVAITVAFTARALEPASARFLRAPDWLNAVDAGALVAAYPQAALKAGVLSGRGVVRCVVGGNGRLETCTPESEAPEGLGFAEAAVRVAPSMRANLWTRDGEAAVGQKVALPVRFILSPDTKPPAAAMR